MPLRTVQNGNDYEMLVSGRVDGQLANEMEIAIIAAIKNQARSIAVNMAEVNFLCSAGIRVLLQYARQMKNSGFSLVVSSPSIEANAVLQSTGFATLILENTSRS